jgi:hypothetical protein
MSNTKLALLAAIWLGVGVTLVIGYFYTPNYRVSRRHNPREFWIAFAVGCAVALLATYLLTGRNSDLTVAHTGQTRQLSTHS